MREESQLDEMRAAIRGDFERLERRRGAQELMQVREQPEPTPAPAGAVQVLDAAEPRANEEAPRSWLARLVAAIPPRQV